ncbi:MAG TPA: hypothetical protein VFL86_08335, partial [Burkholderiaceae bacterium]|nr:hypothetical protein [Burkholderiaceae bacterium]
MKPNHLSSEHRMARNASRSLLAAALLAVGLGAHAADAPAVQDAPLPALASAPVTLGGAAEASGFDGVVQALR